MGLALIARFAILSPKDPEKWEQVEILRYAVVEDFNPLSNQQVLGYLRSRNYKVPLDRKTKKPTTASEGIQKLILENPGDPILPLIEEAKMVDKNASYLTETYLGRDGRFHTEFTYLPDTGRLSSRRPNLQNVPSGKMGTREEEELAKAIRSTIIPSPGMIFLEADWRGIEAALVAFFAEDPDYARICAIDIHSYVAAFKLGVPPALVWSDAQLTAYLAQIKKEHPQEREICKKVNHSDGYGIGLKHLAQILGTTIKGAAEMKALRDMAFPKVAQWKTNVRRLAHLSGRLQNPFGYSRGFFEVYRPKYDRLTGLPLFDEKGNAIMQEGREANEALAFLPQSTAAAMMRDTLVRLGNHPLHGKIFWLLITIHDSILVECLPEHIAQVKDILREAMEHPWPELGGLVVEIDIKEGTNWGEMH